MASKLVYRKDYTPTPYLIDTLDLSFDLNEDVTIVKATSHLHLNPASDDKSGVVFLDGRNDVKLVSVKINGSPVPESNMELTPTSLTLRNAPIGEFDLEIVTELKPQENTKLEGLYKSGGNFCTQNEAQGFRGITFYYDRPDVMSKYTVRVEAERERYPVLLSNGNLVEYKSNDNGRHYTIWKDPFPKPCYLFALVAGNLEMKEDHFKTMSGKDVTLRIYAQKHNIDKVDHAMKSLKEAMEWDEKRFGREYDLDLFNIVAVDDFNMGAMENKSLNVFNTVYVLASAETSTDADFTRVQGVVGHEYFHNWTGNRVTCQDWFQLTLKEGLTVWRDQEFSSDLNSRPVQRISNVNVVRSAQFNEDAGPMAHPIRPDFYVKVDNFYTTTVYRKGAQIINIYRTILGNDGFRKGMDLYFQLYDGKAVTCDDFLNAMSKANNKDLSSLQRWYGQSGTPVVTVTPTYDESSKTYTINVKQKTPPTPDQAEKVAVLIPLKLGLLGPDGKDMPLKLRGSSGSPVTEMALEFDTEEETYVFEDVETKPVLSILRDFSAPVKLDVVGQTEDDLVFLFANDSDPFNRWDAGQIFCKRIVKQLYLEAKNSGSNSIGKVPQKFVDAFKAVLEDESIDGQFASLALSMPSMSEVIGDLPECDPILLATIFGNIKLQLANSLEDIFKKAHAKNLAPPGEAFDISPQQMSKRAMKNLCLRYLTRTKRQEYLDKCLEQSRNATNMTDSIAALSALNDIDCPERTTAFDAFYEKWKNDALVINKWLTLSAMSNLPNGAERVAKLFEHPAYIITNPNSNYSIFRGLAGSPCTFHAEDGSGYALFAERLAKFDAVNGYAAARVAKLMTDFKSFDKNRRELIKKCLVQLSETPTLSDNTKEVVSRCLA